MQDVHLMAPTRPRHALSLFWGKVPSSRVDPVARYFRGRRNPDSQGVPFPVSRQPGWPVSQKVLVANQFVHRSQSVWQFSAVINNQEPATGLVGNLIKFKTTALFVLIPEVPANSDDIHLGVVLTRQRSQFRERISTVVIAPVSHDHQGLPGVRTSPDFAKAGEYGIEQSGRSTRSVPEQLVRNHIGVVGKIHNLLRSICEAY